MATPIYKTYVAVTITVTSSAQKLTTLLTNADPNIKPAGREITFQNDPASTVNIRFGDSAVTTTNCGYVLPPGSSRTYRDAMDKAVSLSQVYVVTDSATAKLNVEIARL